MLGSGGGEERCLGNVLMRRGTGGGKVWESVLGL